MPNIERVGAHSIGPWTGARRRKVVRERCLLFETLVTYLWYGGVAGDGLRSVRGGSPPPIQGRVLYPAHRPPFTGRGSRTLYPARCSLVRLDWGRAVLRYSPTAGKRHARLVSIIDGG